MARRVLPLTDKDIKNAKPPKSLPKDKSYTLFDGGGLYIIIMPDKVVKDSASGKDKVIPGSKLWRLKFRFEGKDKLMSLGDYEVVTLAAARDKREDVKKQIASGIDPARVKKNHKVPLEFKNSFEAVAREWHSDNFNKWCASHAKQKLERLEKDIFPWLKNRFINEITTPELLEVLRRVAGRGALDGAHRLRFDCEKIFAFAIASGRAENNPASQLRGILPPVKNGNHAALTDPKNVAMLLKAIEAYSGTLVVRSALKLAPLLFVRPGELRHMEWTEIDFDAAQWNVPAEKMKMKSSHIVPLCKQAIDILLDLKPLTESSKYVFPSIRTNDRCMSENTVNTALKAMGYPKDVMVGHGFRAMARTMGREQLYIDVEFLEIQLAHKTKAANGTAYDRVAFLPERRKMMQQWADYLDSLKTAQ